MHHCIASTDAAEPVLSPLHIVYSPWTEMHIYWQVINQTKTNNEALVSTNLNVRFKVVVGRGVSSN